MAYLVTFASLATAVAWADVPGERGRGPRAHAAQAQAASEEGPGGRTRLRRWTLRHDPSNRGLSHGWALGRFAGASVSVPSDVDPTQWSGRAGEANYNGSVAWYRTSFAAAQAGMYVLEFQSANFLASVWVDGHALGSHRGSYLPFTMRERLPAGRHTVVVRVDWRNPGAQSRAGFHRTWFNWGGLNGIVYVRRQGESELSEPTIETKLAPDAPSTEAASVQVSVEVHNHGPARTIVPEGTLTRGSQSIPLAFPGLALPAGGSARVTARVDVSAPALWSPATPNLYALTLAVGQESSYTARVGLRELTWRDGRVYLNGQRLRLHGATIQEDAQGHGDALTAADEDRIVTELEEVGANAARAQHPLAPGLLERLDAAGILVWQGVGPVEGAGNWYSHTPALLAQAEAQARTAVLAEQLHPSVLAWNLVDEVAGNGHDGSEVRYVQSLTHWLHRHDPTRMVAVDVWGDHPPGHAGALYAGVDAIAETDYSGWYDYPHDSSSQLAAAMRARLAAMQRTFAGKVLVISEFGAESNTLNRPGSPGSYGFQSRLLAAHIAAYEADPDLSGMLIWLLRDYPLTPPFDGGSVHSVLPHVKLIRGLNQKGLFTYGGQPKAGVVKTVARLLGGLG